MFCGWPVLRTHIKFFCNSIVVRLLFFLHVNWDGQKRGEKILHVYFYVPAVVKKGTFTRHEQTRSVNSFFYFGYTTSFQSREFCFAQFSVFTRRVSDNILLLARSFQSPPAQRRLASRFLLLSSALPFHIFCWYKTQKFIWLTPFSTPHEFPL